MKSRISISIDEKTVSKIQELVRKNTNFRNKSHVVECAVNELMERQK